MDNYVSGISIGLGLFAILITYNNLVWYYALLLGIIGFFAGFFLSKLINFVRTKLKKKSRKK